MVDTDTFLTTLYVMVDDFCKLHLPPEPRPGPAAALGRSEVLALAIFGQWQGFGSERGFYRYARRHLRSAFPALPTREQFNRQLRHHHAALAACFLHLAGLLESRWAPYEALDGTAVPTRDAKRRGAGWLPGLADIGWSNRLGWYEGLHLLLAVTPPRRARSPASPWPPPAPRTSPWQTPFSPCAATPIRAAAASAPRPRGPI